MTAPTMPARRWGDEPDETGGEVTVIVSSRDGVTPPELPDRAASFATAAKRAGWAVRITYALAAVAERRHGNGNVAKLAHRVHSVAVRVARGAVRGFAIWTRTEGLAADGWAFDLAIIGGRRVGGNDLARAVRS